MPERKETGPVIFGDDWPGIFIRGDQAIHFALTLQSLLDELPNTDTRTEILCRSTLEGLVSTLLSCESSNPDSVTAVDDWTDGL